MEHLEEVEALDEDERELDALAGQSGVVAALDELHGEEGGQAAPARERDQVVRFEVQLFCRARCHRVSRRAARGRKNIETVSATSRRLLVCWTAPRVPGASHTQHGVAASVSVGPCPDGAEAGERGASRTASVRKKSVVFICSGSAAEAAP